MGVLTDTGAAGAMAGAALKLSDWVLGKLALAASPSLRRWLDSGKAYEKLKTLPAFADVNVWEIPTYREDSLKAEIAKYNKKIEKMNFGGRVVIQKLGSSRRLLDEVTGEVVQIGEYRVVTDVLARLPGGWQFVALVEHMYDDEGKPTNILHKSPYSKAKIPQKYRTEAATCDHCKLTRRRNETFIVADENGKTMRVGRQCLKDYLGGANAEHILAMSALTYALDSTMQELSEEDGLGGSRGRSDGFALHGVLSVAANLIKQYGYVKSDAFDATPTRDQVIGVLVDAREKGKKIEIPEADQQLAADAIEWAKEIDPSIENDYLANLRTLARTGIVSLRAMGFAVSMIPTYQREMMRRQQQEQERRHPTSRYVGDLDMRLGAAGGTKKKPKPPPLVATVLGRRSEEKTDDYGRFGRVYIQTTVWMTTSGGNDIVAYLRSTVPDYVQPGAIVKVYGTVKRHQESKMTGRAQTVLNRVDFQPATAEDLAGAPPDPMPSTTGAPAPATAPASSRAPLVLTAQDVLRETCTQCYSARGESCDREYPNRSRVEADWFCPERIKDAQEKLDRRRR